MKKVFALLTALMLLAGATLTALPVAAADPVAIERSPSNYVVPEGMNVTYSVTATGSNLSYQWFIRYMGADYPLMDTIETASASWHSYVDAVTLSPTQADITLENVKKGLDGSEIYCIVTGTGGVAVSRRAYISVVTATKTTLKHITPFGVKHLVNTTKDKLVKVPVKITEEDGYNYTYQWYETSDGKLQSIKALIYETEMVLIPDTDKVGTKYYVCMVEIEKGGQKAYSYTAVCQINVNDPNEDNAFTTGVDLQRNPSKTAYKVGESISLSGVKLRAYSEQGFMDVTDTNKLEVYPNRIYSTEQRRLVVAYDGFAAQYDIKVDGSGNGGGIFEIYAVSEQDYYTYSPRKGFSLEAAAKNANGSVTFKWYESNESGERKELYAQGAKLDLPNGLYPEEVNIPRYYLCVATCDGAEASLLFSALLMPADYNPPDDPTPTPVPSTAKPATAVPATAVPATAQPATAAPATAVPATAIPGGDTTTVPGGDVTAEPGTDATAEPGTDATAEPGIDATVEPGSDATAAPVATPGQSGQSGQDNKDSGKNAEIIKGVIIAGGILGAAVIIGIFMVIISKKKK